MPSNPSGPIRRAQLIAPFGVGAMVTVPGGTSLIIAGLDFWYKNHDSSDICDKEEFKFEEWRLQDLLGVSHLRLPPDYRDSFWTNREAFNLGITIPAYRFPAWHFCPDCKLLREWPMYTRGKGGKIKCPECERKNKTRYMFQVPFIAMCELGHLQDFPWREWVHQTNSPSCEGTLRLISTGSATLAGQKVKCEGCGLERNLEGITIANTSNSGVTTTRLSKSLSKNGEPFLCRGMKPWLGPNIYEPCNAHIKGSLRSASNVYFAQIYSSIYLPRTEDKSLQELENLLGNPPLSSLVSAMTGLGANVELIAQAVKAQQPRLLAPFSDKQINSVIKITTGKRESVSNGHLNSSSSFVEEEQVAFRRIEYEGLRKERDDILLRVKSGNLSNYSELISDNFSRIMLVEKLQETRTLAGFTRVFPENSLSFSQRQQMLWKESTSEPDRSWLPAYKVYGEGIFFEFNENKVSDWEHLDGVIDRVKPLLKRYQELQKTRKFSDRPIGPRFILLHTFAHIVMNRLTFECGYSSAALRERLYVSSNPAGPMAGVLIYTADGDSEGTMGGLVRMGKPGYIEPVIQRALENALWCSADPVCMEMGKSQGQGPDSTNLAACHNCALVPETACEEFNRFLDRAVIIGELENPSIAFFKEIH
jgi:hypothetical protein